MFPTAFLRLGVMALLPLVLWLLPIRASARTLMLLAFSLWLAGGIVLAAQGLTFLEALGLPLLNWLLPIVLAALVGFAKGRFILSKTSARNIDRLNALTGRTKLVHVYSLRSWLVIGIMLLFSVALTLGHMPLFWRGLVNIAIGMGLIVSSRAYLKELQRGGPIPPLENGSASSSSSS